MARNISAMRPRLGYVRVAFACFRAPTQRLLARKGLKRLVESGGTRTPDNTVLSGVKKAEPKWKPRK